MWTKKKKKNAGTDNTNALIICETYTISLSMERINQSCKIRTVSSAATVPSAAPAEAQIGIKYVLNPMLTNAPAQVE